MRTETLLLLHFYSTHNFHLMAAFWFLVCISAFSTFILPRFSGGNTFAFCASCIHTLMQNFTEWDSGEGKLKTALNGNISAVIREISPLLIKMQSFQVQIFKSFSHSSAEKNFVVFAFLFSFRKEKKLWGYFKDVCVQFSFSHYAYPSTQPFSTCSRGVFRVMIFMKAIIMKIISDVYDWS